MNTQATRIMYVRAMTTQPSNPESNMTMRGAQFQFSLRTLVVAVTFFALLFAIWRVFLPFDVSATLAVSSLIIKGVMWFLLIAFGVWAYRRLQCPSLPWLGIYATLAIPLSVIMPLFLRALVDTGRFPMGTSMTIGDSLVLWTTGNTLVQSLTSLIVATMVLAEIAVLIARVYPGLDVAPVRLFCAARAKAALLGAMLVALTLAAPICAAVLWLSG